MIKSGANDHFSVLLFRCICSRDNKKHKQDQEISFHNGTKPSNKFV